MSKPQQAAIEALASDSRKRIAVEVVALKRFRDEPTSSGKPRLRFDKVVIRLMQRLEAALDEIVPGGKTVFLTVTAPIRLASKTADALENRIRILLTLRRRRSEQDEIHGNRVRIEILKDGSGRAPKLLGLVHNADTDPSLLLNMTQELLQLKVGAKPNARRSPGDRWLVLISARGMECLEPYRYLYSQMRMPAGFQKVLIVFNDGRVGTLAG